MTYSWTDNSMEVGVAVCNPDVVDENLMYLKTEVDDIPNQINPDRVDWGTVSENKTLTSGIWYTGNYTGSHSIAGNFTIVDSGKTEVAFVNFTTNNASYPTFSGVTWDYTPAWDTSKNNLITIFSDDGGTTYYANHRILGA